MKKYLLIAVVSALALVFLGVFAGSAQAAGPLIVIDPGHSAASLTVVDTGGADPGRRVRQRSGESGHVGRVSVAKGEA